MNTANVSGEVEVIREAIGGSPIAFEVLVRTHQRGVRLAIAKWISCQSTIDDLSQEVFLAAFDKLHTFNTAGAFSAWLHGIARNKVLEHLRSDYRRHQNEKQLMLERLAKWKLEAFDNDPAEDSEQFAKLQHCLDKLAPESRRLVDQHYFEGATLESIAGKANRTSGSLRMLLFRIRKALAKCVRGQMS